MGSDQMVFECEDERERLVAELRRLDVRADIVAWVADPDTDLTVLAAAAAVPFWDEILRRVSERPSTAPRVVREPVFGLAVQAYLERWRAEVEQRDLFEAAEVLGRAARAHLIARSHAGD
jgi:hypothetical protein